MSIGKKIAHKAEAAKGTAKTAVGSRDAPLASRATRSKLAQR